MEFKIGDRVKVKDTYMEGYFTHGEVGVIKRISSPEGSLQMHSEKPSKREGHWWITCTDVELVEETLGVDDYTSADRGAIKHDGDKVRMDLLPYEALEEVAKVMTFGAKKYAAHNWRKGFKYSRPFGAAIRHLTSWFCGEDKDPETGLSHLAHAACCVLFMLTFVLTKTGEDDRFIYKGDE